MCAARSEKRIPVRCYSSSRIRRDRTAFANSSTDASDSAALCRSAASTSGSNINVTIQLHLQCSLNQRSNSHPTLTGSRPQSYDQTGIQQHTQLQPIPARPRRIAIHTKHVTSKYQ